ncbi:MAG: nucleoside 2-deoxyribosyltransferase [Acidobacteriia bacterium]|nr:nucleoside 2-deoxyribosyltransferase [Terriglobia bacterium]
MTQSNIEASALEDMLSALAKIIAYGLSYEQRTAVLRGYDLRLSNTQRPDEFRVFHALKSLASTSQPLEYVRDLLHRIEGTRSFYQNVGPELDRLRYLVAKHLLPQQEELTPPYVFVLLPFKEEFLATFESVIRPCLQDLGCAAEHAKDIATVGSIIEVIFLQISKAAFLVADTTGSNPNVFYEIGYAHALGKKVLLLTQDTAKIPFDIGGLKHIHYHPGSPHTLQRDLRRYAEVLCKQLKSP